ncbi:YhjD/YihY/BrkB family envelope integrity protein [Geodermatophilus sp. SYSU D00691]
MSAGALGRVTGRLERTFPGRCLRAVVDVQGLDRAMALAAQAFTALIPLLLLLSAALPLGSRNVVADAIVAKFRLTGDAADDVQSLFARSGEAGVGILSVVLLVFSGISLTRRLQNMYLQAWRLEPPRGVRRALNAAFGLGALLVELSLLYAARQLVGALPVPGVLSWSVAAAANLVLWTSVPWLLLDRRVRWRRLLPTGALAGIAVALYGVVTTLYMPALMERYSQRYGIFGVTLSLVGWFVVVSVILVATTAVGAELDRAPEPWARRLVARFRGEVPTAQPETATRAGASSGTSDTGPRMDQTRRAV